MNQERRSSNITVGYRIEYFFEASEENILFAAPGLKQDRRQCGTEGQRHNAGKYHRNGDGNGELLVQLTRHATHEGGRNKYGAQHQHDSDNRASHLVHRVPCCFFGREAELVHVALDVFDHHDGIVNDDTDGENHAEQGQSVDREPQHVHTGEGADDGDRYCQQRDQRRPPVLQEYEDHDHDQRQRFKEGMDYFFDGELHELGGVIREIPTDTCRETFG